MEKSHVALVKRACRICGEAENAEILLATKYDYKGEPLQDLSKHNGQVVGFLEGPCTACKTRLNTEEFYVLIEVDEAKTDDRNNPWLTGTTLQIKKDSDFGRHMQQHIKHGVAYISIEVANHIKGMIS